MGRQNKEKKKIYKITELGIAVLRRALAKENQLAVNMRNLFEEYMKSVPEVESKPDLSLTNYTSPSC
jgi:DNA-binding PadR family transcriptional regulator